MASSVVIYHPSHTAMPQIGVQGTSRGSSSPLVEFLFFHKAIRAELARLHEDALAVEQGSETEIRALLDRYHFLRAIYKHHSRAEDEVRRAFLPASVYMFGISRTEVDCMVLRIHQ